MTDTKSDGLAIWQEKVADQLRRGRIKEVRAVARDGLFYVVGSYQASDGNEIWDSYAYFSKQQLAEAAVRTIKRTATLN